MTRTHSDSRSMARHYAIKAAIRNPGASEFAFKDQKTMYGGKLIVAGDSIFVFASENEGGSGLICKGVVTRASPTPRMKGVARQTPRVSIVVSPIARVKRPLGRAELRSYRDWGDGRPATELNFKLYRQATDKIAGLSEEVADYLCEFLL